MTDLVETDAVPHGGARHRRPPSRLDPGQADRLKLGPKSPKHAYLTRVLSPTFAEKGDVKIICVGVMRTGLKTLRRALNMLDYPRIYDQEQIVNTFELWDQVLRNRGTKRTYAELFRDSQVVMGMPIFCFWEQIHELYPNAKVILTVRDEEEWWASVLGAKRRLDTQVPGAPLRYGTMMRSLEKRLVPSYHKFCDILRFAWATTLGAHAMEDECLNEAAARSSYRKHNAHVKATLSSNFTKDGSPQLLVYDVKQGWGPLSDFLGREAPDLAFPHIRSSGIMPGAVSDSNLSMIIRSSEHGLEGREDLEALFEQESEFGMLLRRELRFGLGIAIACLTVFLALLAVVHLTRLITIPVNVLMLLYVAAAIIGWNAYVVMHTLVMHVPAFVVLPLAMKSLLIASLLHACFLSYGVLKEMLVTQHQVAPQILSLSSRVASVLAAAVILKVREGGVSLGVPLAQFAAFALTNEGSTFVGYEMLRYLSFPVQVMAKSCKMLPTMLMGRLVNKTEYEWYQYLQSVAAFLCVAVMHLSDGHGSSPKAQGAAGQRAPSAGRWGVAMGASLLVIFFVCDSFTSQYQTSLYKRYPSLSQTKMMLGGNLVGLGVIAAGIPFRWDKVSASLALLHQRPHVLWLVMCLGLCGALGQICIYYAIRVLGALSFTWIMTARQLLSVLISLVFFGHGISLVKVLCIAIVFSIMSWRELTRAIPRRVMCCRVPRSRRSRRDLQETPSASPCESPQQGSESEQPTDGDGDRLQRSKED